MTKIRLLLACLTFGAFITLGSVPVKADTVTATNMIPILRAMYHVDMAESVLNDKIAALNACRANNAPEYEKALAQAAVMDATNLVNTLNVLIVRDTALIEPAPPGVVNPATFATNSLAAQQAWNDFMNKEKFRALVLFNTSAPFRA